MSDVNPESVRFEFKPPYPPMSAERIARLEEEISEKVLRPLIENHNE